MQQEPETTASRFSNLTLSMSLTNSKSLVPFSLAAILVLAAVIRLVGIGDESLWGDETHTAVRIQSSWWTLIAQPIENNQPLHFLLLKAWTAVAGHSEVALRFPSAVFGLLTIVMTFVLGRRLANDWVGLGAALVIAVLPTMVWYSQETRTYAMQSFFAVTSLYLLVMYLEEGQRRHIVGYWLAATLGLYTHFYFGLYIVGNFVAGALWILIHRKQSAWAPLFIAHMAIGASLLPRIPVMLDYLRDIGQTSYTTTPMMVIRALIRQVEFTVPRQSFATAVPGVVYVAWSLIGISALVVIYSPKSRILFPAAVAATATGFLISAGVIAGVPIVGRYLVPTLPFLFIMAVYSVYMLLSIRPIRRPEVVLPVAGIAVALVLWLGIYEWRALRSLDTREDWRGMAAFVEGEAGGDDKIVVETFLAFRSYQYYATSNMEVIRQWTLSDWPCEDGEAMWLIGRTNGPPVTRWIKEIEKSCVKDTSRDFPFSWGVTRYVPAS